MVPTRRLWFLLALGLPLAVVGPLLGVAWLVLVWNILVLLAAWITTRLAPDAKDLRITRRFDPVLSVRARNRIELVVENDGDEPLLGRLRDESPAGFDSTEREFSLRLEPGDEARYEYFLIPRERGSDYFRGTFLRLACPLGLAEREIRLPTEEPVRVYPNVLALREFDLLKQQGRLREIGIRRSRIRGLGTEFESLRDYAEGDDYRKIDWKASARRAKLVVRQFEQERNQAVILVIDVGRHMLSEVNGVRKLDHALDACLMLMHAAATAGDQIGLMVYADRVRRYIPPKKGRSQVGVIIEALHDLVAEPVESDHQTAFATLATKWKRRSLLVSFTELADADTARDLLVSLGPLSRRHLALLVRVSDAHLKVALNAKVAEGGMYEKAAAILVETDRREAASVLDAAGVHHLEAEPQDLASALVSYYFSVKERSLI